MNNKKYTVVAACMMLGLLAIQPAMAMSRLGKQMQHQDVEAASDGNAGEYYLSGPSSLHHFLPKLVGPRLYLHLLQSDTFITLSGLAESMLDEQGK